MEVMTSAPKPLWVACLQVVAGQMDKGLQNSTCTPADDILYTFYSPQDRLPQVMERLLQS